MNIAFDKFNRQELPSLILKNTNGEELGILDNSTDVNMILSFNTLSELSMKVFKTDPYYDYVNMLRIIEVDGFGQFIIVRCPEISNGVERFKSVQAYSLERELVGKNTGQIKGTLKFYDPNPTNIPNTLLGKLVSRLNGLWTIGYVDVELMDLYRTFDIIDQSMYNFMMTTVEQAYGCIFKFDTVNRTINVYTPENAITSTSIYMSYENLIKEVQIDPQEEQLCTALEVLGGGDLDIRQVNPLGSNFIYDFSYFIVKGYMSTQLASKVTQWQDKVELQQQPYSNLLLQLKQLQADLLSLNTQLTELESDKKALLQSMSTEMDGLNRPSEIKRLNGLVKAKDSQISGKKNEITSKNSQITSKQNELKTINTLVSFESNFTQNELKELSLYIKEQSFQEENIIKTAEMTDVEIMDNALELYKQGKGVLSKLSKPRYVFSMESVNFLAIKEFAPFISQLQLGSKILIDIENGFDLFVNVKRKVEEFFNQKLVDLFSNTMEEMFYDKQSYIEPILLQIQFSFTNPSNLSLTFGDRLRLQDEALDFEELMGQTVNTTNQVNGNSINWGDWINSGSQNKVTNFVNSSLDASKNELISSDNQQITMGAYGLQGKQLDPSTQQYLPNQVWLTSNQLCFTKDGWDSVEIAIGKILLPSGIWDYGIAAKYLVGNIIFGSQIAIQNDGGTITMDSNGFTMTEDSGNGRVIISPATGFALQKKVGANWNNTLSMDINGNANFSGDITGSNITGSSIKGGSIIIGDGKATTFKMVDGDPFLMYVNAASSQFPALSMSDYQKAGSSTRYVGINTGSASLASPYNSGTTFYGNGLIYSGQTLTIAHPASKNYVVYIDGNFEVGGDKLAIIPTQHYGVRSLYCDESDRSYFTTKGLGATINGECIIKLDPIFMETIELNSEYPYIINVTPYGDARVWVDLVEDGRFIIKSDKDVRFSYQLNATRISYGNIYLEKAKADINKKSLEGLQKMAIERMSNTPEQNFPLKQEGGN